jgi:predicted RNA-binding protein with TRAM domain
MAYTDRGGSFRRYNFSYKAPVELGKVYEADIVEMSRRGDAGVAKIQGFVIFVSGAKPGDHVKFEITKVGRRYATAEIVREEAADEDEAEVVKEETVEEDEDDD